MGWFTNFLTSSIGRKLVMSLTGLFLIIFLIVHLAGNLQLLAGDEGKSFNLYAEFMTSNPFIETISIILYLSILVHAVQGWLLWRKNSVARGDQGYAVKVTRVVSTDSFPARNMGWLGTIIFVFLMIHLYQFWLQMKLDFLPYVTYDGEQVKNLYRPVEAAYSNPRFVIFYVASMVVIALHLDHGFQSAFQTLGINHRKYTPVIKFVGKAYAILIPLGFALIPIVMYGQSRGWW
jgi:succinate dehydrogenase / fumarate reductase cytochrome b subunit